MILKYNVDIDDNIIKDRLKQLINLTYKLLPLREEQGKWESLLSTIIEEIAGMNELFPVEYQEIIFPLLCKLEGLFKLTLEEDFFEFRRVIFECLNMIGKVKDNVDNK